MRVNDPVLNSTIVGYILSLGKRCIPGNNCQQADAEQAYVQAPMRSPVTTWISLPREQWPKHWEGMDKPVVVLEKALNGHPDSGTYWEEYCDKHCRSIGFAPITN